MKEREKNELFDNIGFKPPSDRGKPHYVTSCTRCCVLAFLLLTGCSTIVNSGRKPVPPEKRSELDWRKDMDPWVWGNAVFAVFPPVAALGIAIDAYSGQWYREPRNSYHPSDTNATASIGATDKSPGNEAADSPPVSQVVTNGIPPLPPNPYDELAK